MPCNDPKGHTCCTYLLYLLGTFVIQNQIVIKMTSLKVIPKLEKIKLSGEVPLYLRITKDRKAKFISLQVNIKPEHWDYSANRVKPRHPNSGRINAFISRRLYEAEDTMLETVTKNKFISGKALKDKIMGNNSESLLKYFDKYNTEQEKLENIGTHRKCKAIYEKLKVFVGNKDLLFSEVTVAFLKGYEFYLRTTLNNATNTVHSNLKVIRKLFNDAINEELIDKDIYPFNRYKLVWEKPHKGQLNEEDIIKILDLDLMRGSKIDDFRNMFIFCVYSGGLRISDLLKLKWQDFDGKNINVLMTKTNELVSVKVPTKGMEILNIYGLQNYKNNYDEYVFPFLKSSYNYSKQEMFNAISSLTALANKYLKEIAKMAKLNQLNLSNHWGRRSFTSIALSKGMSLEHVSKLLGHGGVATTLESYAHFAQKDLNLAMDVFD